MDWHDHIGTSPGILSGKPVIKGTRISVEHVLGLFEAGWGEGDILDSYPHISREEVRACLAYARSEVSDAKLFPMTDV